MSKLDRGLTKAIREGQDTWNFYSNKSYWFRIKHVMWLSDLTNPFFDSYYSVLSLFKRSIRAVAWFSTVWGTQDWDWSSTLVIWAYSLKRLRKDIAAGPHYDKSKTTRSLTTAINLLERLQNSEEYTTSHMNYFHKKWNDTGSWIRKPHSFDSKGKVRTYTLHNDLYESLSDYNKALYKKEKKAIYKHKKYLFEQDIDLLCNILKKHLQSWWA